MIIIFLIFFNEMICLLVFIETFTSFIFTCLSIFLVLPICTISISIFPLIYVFYLCLGFCPSVFYLLITPIQLEHQFIYDLIFFTALLGCFVYSLK